MTEIFGDKNHNFLIDTVEPSLCFKKAGDFDVWKGKVRKRLKALLGMGEIEKNKCLLDLKIESSEKFEDHTRIRFVFESERNNFVPCYLLKPNGVKKKHPVMICLQGHSTGFHNSVGEPKFEGDKEYIETRGDFAVQAVRNGYAALCIEQRGMGETKSKNSSTMCDFTSNTALLLGRTLIGERVWDISRAIDCLKDFEFVDTDNITCMGNSGGGTATFYASCLEERITRSAPSCAFSSFKDSIGKMFHCSCNYVPGILKYFDMGDLSCLIAPRPLIIFAGVNDPIFPIEGVKKQFETVKKIYKTVGAEGKCKLNITNKDHYFDKDLFWKEFGQLK